MDPRISWIQPEQLGPATNLWMTLWQTLQGLKSVSVEPSNNSTFCGQNFNCNAMPDSQPDFIPIVAQIPRDRNISEPHGGKKRRENPAKATELNYSRKIISRGGVPWKRSDYPIGIVGLHMEIEDFYNYMHPTKDEKRMREHVIKEVEQVIKDTWEHARVDVFGSFRTGLYLPTSDIDLVVFGEWEKLPLWTLQRQLVRKKIADESSIKVLDRAAVPIVKLTHKDTNVRVDISFNMEAGVRSVSLIKEFLTELPALPKLVFVLKQFILQRDLNEVWTGGLSSYALILMCVNFLQLHARNDGYNINANLGVLLLEFFELYGRHFNYANVAISVKNGGSYIRKNEIDSGSPFQFLSIEDPLTPGNDLGRGSYGMQTVKQSFDYGYLALTTALLGRFPSRRHPSETLLSRIVKVTDEVIEYREEIRKQWRSTPTKRNEPRIPSPSSLSSDRSSGYDEMLASAEQSNGSSLSSPADSEVDSQQQPAVVFVEHPSKKSLNKEKPSTNNSSKEKFSKRKEKDFYSKSSEASSSSQSEQEKKTTPRNPMKPRKPLKRDFDNSKNKKNLDVSVNSSKSHS